MFKRFNKKRFERTVELVLQTPPLKYRQDDSVTVVSMVSSSTVAMYLVAIKSFMNYFGYGTIEAINDGTLTTQDLERLKHHIPNINISNAADVDTHGCPTYISWKRLFRVQELSKTSYVVQLDSDTLSLGPLYDVHEHVKSNTGFAIGSKRWGKPVDVGFLRDIGAYWNWKNWKPQPLAEVNMHKMEFFADGTKYIRGCAGFAGYPKDFATIETIQKLSDEIESYVGPNWRKWGSEQTATLCLISKTDNADVLPWPMYQNFKFPITNEKIESMNFVHFIGSNRFDDGVYRRLVIQKLAEWSN